LAEISFELAPAPPFRLDLTVWTLRRRPHNRVDRWDDNIYRRVLVLGEQPVEVAVTQSAPPDAPRLDVRAGGPGLAAAAEAALAALLTRMLGLDVDLGDFYRLAAREPRLHQLALRFRGVKPPRYPSVFEALANAVACQQISLTAGIHVLNRLAAAFGLKLSAAGTVETAFPRPGDLAGRQPEELRGLGFSFSKARSLIGLSQEILAGRLDLEGLASQDDEQVVQRLQALKGIGRWSAEYALLRGLGRLSVFPGDDVGARQRLKAWLHLAEPLDYEGVRRSLERWHPFGGLIYFHFLLNHLADEGYVA
jgi:DNA-3-methyladenine glycosylase II